jgi:Leucine-rich repeat (LRR) protein
VIRLFPHSSFKALLCLSGVFFACISQAQDLIIPEPALQSAIARSLGVSEQKLSKSLVENKLIRLQANDVGIRDLRGLEHAKNLESLVLRDNLIDDLSPIHDLRKIKNLDLSGNRLTSLSSFSLFQSTTLRILNLSRNRLLGLSGIDRFPVLAQLDVSNNALIDLEGVQNLKGLVNLYAQGNQLGRVEAFVDRNRNKEFDPGELFTDESGNGKRETDPLGEIADLPKLASLHLYDNRISQLGLLTELPELHTLLLSGNLIESVLPLSKLEALKILALGNNRIHTLDGLGELTKLERLNLSENQICDLRILRELSQLTQLDLNSNLLTDLTDLSNLRNLQTLGLSRNLIRDPSPVIQIQGLRRLTLSFNQIPTNQSKYKDLFREAEARGVYLNVRSQTDFRPRPYSLVRSLIGHSSSNAYLGDYLRLNGYPRLIELFLEQKIKPDDLDKACLAWEDALKFGKSLSTISFPGK